MEKTLSAIAPAKLILSGEHSVIYGQPAAAMAIKRYTTATTTWHYGTPKINFDLTDIKYVKAHTIHALDKLKLRLQDKYNDFLAGNLDLRGVLKKPFELLQYSVGNLLSKLNFQLPSGVDIKLNSDIPIGCGMGSSAAAIMSVLLSLINLFNLEIELKKILKLGLEAENLQHGKSSGLDLYLAAYGGCVSYNNFTSTKLNEVNFPIHIVNTGAPGSSTGECVQHVRKTINEGSLLDDFSAVTNTVINSIEKNDEKSMQKAVKENNKLLEKLGVVPQRVKEFITDLELSGNSAKICGSGSISGENAGIVMIVGNSDLNKVTSKHGYNLEQVKVENSGARIIRNT